MNPIIGVLTEQIGQTRGAMASATVLIDGFEERLAAAKADALAKGATEEQLVELTNLEAALDTETQTLAAAVAKNPLPGEGTGGTGGTQATDPNNPPAGAGNSFDGTGWINSGGQPIDQQGNPVAATARRR